MQRKLGEQPLPPPKPAFEPTIHFWILACIWVGLFIAGIEGHKIAWIPFALITLVAVVIWSFVRNDTR